MKMKLVITEFDQEFMEVLAAALLKAGNVTANQVQAVSGPPPVQPAQADPWLVPQQPVQPPAQAPVAPVQPVAPQAAPRQPQQARQRPPTGVYTVTTPNGVQSWTLGAQNAPNCHCPEGIPAAYVVGNKNGKDWQQWRCAYGAGDAAGLNWRDKCNFSAWG
jgi:hypothetical protein